MRPSASAFACLSVLSVADPALAVDFRLTTFEDEHDGVCDAHCSLRDAVSAHNQLGGSNRILLSTGVYQLSLPAQYGELGEVTDEDQNLNGDLDLFGGSLALVGRGQKTSIIDANELDRVFEVNAGARLEVNDLTLRNGLSTLDGGGIENRGGLLIRRSTLTANRIFNPWYGRSRGGAIYSEGTLEIYDSVFDDNSVFINDDGAGQGGALFNSGKLIVRDTLFHDQGVSTDDGAGSGGVLFNIGEASVARVSMVEISGNGEGLAVRNDGNGVLSLSNVTISLVANWYFSGDATVANGYRYLGYPGTPRMKLLNVTIAGNEAEAAGLSNRGILDVRNTLIVGHRGDNCYNEGTLVNGGGLLLGHDRSNCRANIHVDNEAIYGKLLYALKDNPSGLPAFSLPLGSAALDAGVGPCPLTDQRRYPRPADGDGDGVAKCDIGAYERGAKN